MLHTLKNNTSYFGLHVGYGCPVFGHSFFPLKKNFAMPSLYSGPLLVYLTWTWTTLTWTLMGKTLFNLVLYSFIWAYKAPSSGAKLENMISLLFFFIYNPLVSFYLVNCLVKWLVGNLFPGLIFSFSSFIGPKFVQIVIPNSQHALWVVVRWWTISSGCVAHVNTEPTSKKSVLWTTAHYVMRQSDFWKYILCTLCSFAPRAFLFLVRS